MRLRDIRVIETADKLKEIAAKKELLLVYSPKVEGFVLFNTSVTGKFGYYHTTVYKGITEHGKIYNMFLWKYEETRATASTFTDFLYFPDEITDVDDRMFLEEKRAKIMALVNKKKNHRDMMEIII